MIVHRKQFMLWNLNKSCVYLRLELCKKEGFCQTVTWTLKVSTLEIERIYDKSFDLRILALTSAVRISNASLH